MNTRQHWIAGMAGLGLVLAAPVQAAPHFIEDAFIVAERGQPEEARPDQPDARRDRDTHRASRNRTERNRAESEEPEGYGYGYERRQQHRLEEDNRRRGRR